MLGITVSITPEPPEYIQRLEAQLCELKDSELLALQTNSPLASQTAQRHNIPNDVLVPLCAERELTRRERNRERRREIWWRLFLFFAGIVLGFFSDLLLALVMR